MIKYDKFSFSALALDWADRKVIRPVKSWLLICWWWWFDLSFASLIAPVVNTTSVILSSNKIQNRDIQVPAYLGCPGKWPLNECHCCHKVPQFIAALLLCHLLLYACMLVFVCVCVCVIYSRNAVTCSLHQQLRSEIEAVECDRHWVLSRVKTCCSTGCPHADVISTSKRQSSP